MPEASRRTGYRVEALAQKHDRTAFSCGVAPLDRYLREQASQDACRRVAAPFVLCEGESNAVLGFYTLSAMGIDVGAWLHDVARRLPRYPVVPATLLGRLAVDARLRGKNMGEHLLLDALRRALLASREVASVAVVVEAKDADVASFYRRYSFRRFEDEPRRLFLPMGTIEALFASPPGRRAT